MNMDQAIRELLGAIKQDYIDWTGSASKKAGKEEPSDYFQRTIGNWDNTVEVKTGSKYIKITRDGSVWGFIVNTDTDKKFEYGDILMAAGYNAPARNKARGNVFKGYNVKWTGPNYLR